MLRTAAERQPRRLPWAAIEAAAAGPVNHGLVDLLKRPEGKTLEFKRDLSGPDGTLKTIVAFANTAGGTVLVGVEDRSGHVRGLRDALDLEERLANLISDSIAPRLAPDIEILPWRRTQVLAVQVYPSPARPHHFKREGPDDGVYVRVGSTNRRADRELVEELRRFARGKGFDEQPMPGLDSEALDFRAASESFAAVRRLTRRDLATLHLVTDHQGRKAPTVGGMLLFGRDRERHFPDAWIQAGRFHGADRSRIVDRAEIRSLPVRAIEEAIAFVQKHATHGAEIGAVRRRERWNLPPVSALGKTDRAIMGALAGSTGLLTSEIAKAIGLTPRATRTRLARLVGSGLLREVGTGPQDPKRRYFHTR